jgi:Asp-tRNA(Asn)/Glu-tRNA(Gln) amidotransferase A subunit family amidase
MAYFSGAGLATTLLPGVLWARMQDARAARLTAAMLKDALAVAGLEFTEEEREEIVNGVNQNLDRYENIRTLDLDAVAPPVYFSPLVPGTPLDRIVRGGSGASAATTSSAPPPPQPPSAIRDHFQVANVCGYAAISVPNGFTAEGKPKSITFLGRLYNEAQIMALAKAYQDRAGWTKTQPKLTN